MKLMVVYDDNDPDYGACAFNDKYSWVEVYNDMRTKGMWETNIEDDENCFTIEIYEFDIPLSKDLNDLIHMLKDDFMDYDALKVKDFMIFGD